MFQVIKKLENFNHLQEKNLSYFDHFCQAISISISGYWASTKMFVHALWPDLFAEESDFDAICKKLHNIRQNNEYSGNEYSDNEYKTE